MADSVTSPYALTKPEVGASNDTWGTKLNGNFDKLAALVLGYFGATGTNAQVITTGQSLTAVPIGWRISFLAASTNSGATTLNVDGIGAVTCLTVTGQALPAGYIRTDAPTSARYNGTNWILDREVEYASNSNGQAVKYADGLMICRNTETVSGGVTTAIGSLFRSAEVTWTYPTAFAASNFDTVIKSGVFGPAMWVVPSTTVGMTNADVDYYVMCATSTAASPIFVELEASGKWYN